jgi:hypothetical protein
MVHSGTKLFHGQDNGLGHDSVFSAVAFVAVVFFCLRSTVVVVVVVKDSAFNWSFGGKTWAV